MARVIGTLGDRGARAMRIKQRQDVTGLREEIAKALETLEIAVRAAIKKDREVLKDHEERIRRLEGVDVAEEVGDV